MSLLRGRTWLMRGGAVVILAVLVGAWALGLAEARDKEKSPPPNVVKPIDPGDSPLYDIQKSRVVEKSDAPRTREADPSDEAHESVIEPIVDTADETDVDGGATDPSPTGADPTPNSPNPDWDPDDPSTPPPTNPPGQPEEECTDLVSVLNCVLDPITGQP